MKKIIPLLIFMFLTGAAQAQEGIQKNTKALDSIRPDTTKIPVPAGPKETGNTMAADEKIYNIMGIDIKVATIATIIIALLSIILTIINLAISHRNSKRARKQRISDETQDVYDLWFGVEFYHLRKDYDKYMNLVKAEAGWENRELWQMLGPAEISRVMQLVFFFDKVGWLYKADLINIPYIIGPMKHWIEKVYIDMQPNISRRRKTDKVYNKGFQALAQYTIKHPIEKIKELAFLELNKNDNGKLY